MTQTNTKDILFTLHYCGQIVAITLQRPFIHSFIRLWPLHFDPHNCHHLKYFKLKFPIVRNSRHGDVVYVDNQSTITYGQRWGFKIQVRCERAK